MAPQNVHALVPKTCDYDVGQGKRDFADVIMVMNPEMKR